MCLCRDPYNCRKDVYYKTRLLGNRRSVSTIFGSTWHLWFAAQCGLITCVWRTLPALVTDMYGDTYSMVGDVVVNIVLNSSRVHSIIKKKIYWLCKIVFFLLLLFLYCRFEIVFLFYKVCIY